MGRLSLCSVVNESIKQLANPKKTSLIKKAGNACTSGVLCTVQRTVLSSTSGAICHIWHGTFCSACRQPKIFATNCTNSTSAFGCILALDQRCASPQESSASSLSA